MTQVAGLLPPLTNLPLAAAAKPKRVIVAGAGLAGLTCAYELTKRGHNVVVLEASRRTGGHVHTLQEGLPDGLYADIGAEHFTKPGYDLCWKYFEELNLTVLPYPHRENVLRVVDSRMVSEREALALDRAKLVKDGFSNGEIQYLRKDPSGDLLCLYFNRFLEKIRDEYQPFGVGLDHLDEISVAALLREEGASAAAVRQFGIADSALHTIWKMAILRLRHIDEDPHALFRLKGGNQSLPDALAKAIGDRIQTGQPVVAIQQSGEAVQVTCKSETGANIVEGDDLVCCKKAVVLRGVKMTPAWPEAKQYALENVPYTVESRPVFVSKTKFWEADGYSGNLNFDSNVLGPVWPMALEVPTPRGVLIGTSQAGITSQMALAVFNRFYPGKSTIERAQVVDWSRDPWSMTCEARTYRLR